MIFPFRNQQLTKTKNKTFYHQKWDFGFWKCNEKFDIEDWTMKDTYIFAKSVLSDSPFLGQFKTSSWEIYDESKPIYIYLTICPFRSFPSVYHLSQLTKETPLYTSIRMKNGRGYIFKTSFSLDITKTNHGFVMESFSQKLNSRDKVRFF